MRRISMDNRSETVTLQQAFDAFIRKCRLQNLAEATINFYEESFPYLEKVIPLHSSANLLDESHIEEFVLLLKPSMNENSINTRLQGIRTFINYCIKLGYTKPMKIQLLKTDSTIKKTYTTEELKVLLEKPDTKKCSFAEFRTWAAINILLGTGCRIGSLVELKIKDILFEDMLIKFNKTKGRKQLFVPLSRSLYEVLELYLQYRSGEPEDFVICDQCGQKIQENGLIHAVSKYNWKRGVMKTSCHLFRHTFAKIWVQNNGDIFRLQKILGHEDIKVTQQYLRDFGNRDLQESFDKYNALDAITKQQSKSSIKLK